MEELLKKIQDIVRNETVDIKTKLDNIETDVSVLKEDVSGLKTDVNVLKEDVSGLKADVNVLKEDDCRLQKDINDIKKNNQILLDAMFTLENDYFKKIDVMYDYVLLQKELNDIKFENINSIKKIVDHNELKILNHETRIECLENNFNQTV